MDRISSTYTNARGLLESQPDRYITAPIERGRFATVVRATGTLSPISTVDVSSELSGRISEVLVDFNDKVREQSVVVLRSEGDNLVLDGGLKAGDTVVTAGAHVLSPGQLVSLYIEPTKR